MLRPLRGLWIVLLTITMLALCSVAVAQLEPYVEERPTKRLALVIGNEHYKHQDKIPSSTIDASKVTQILRSIDFTVFEVHDVTNSAEFWELHFKPFLSHIKENDFALFYFS